MASGNLSDMLARAKNMIGTVENETKPAGSEPLGDALEEVCMTEEERAELAKPCTSVDAAAWLDEPDEPDNPLISGLVEVGSYVALVGPAKAAKTWLEAETAVCIAAGVDWFGRKVKRQRVYVANVEVSAKQYKKRERAICRRLGINHRDLGGWLFVDNLRGHKVTFDDCYWEARRRKAKVVFIDPFYQVFKGQETNEKDCQDATEEMKRFLAAGMTLFIVFHSPKGNPGDREIVDMISGSSVLARFPENVIAILPHATDKNARVIDCSVLRDYAPPDPFTVKLDDGALVLAPDIAPELKSGRAAGRYKSPAERDAEKVERHNVTQKKIGAACLAFLEKRGDKLPGTGELFAELRKVGAKGEVEEYLKSAKENGTLATEAEKVKDGNGGWKVKPPKQGGKTFISTPERIDAYRRTVEELPL